MPCYAVYGGVLESALELPELPAATEGPARWRFTVVPALPPVAEARELGADRIYGDVHARLFAHADGHRIVVEDTGIFDLSADRRRVAWQEHAAAWPDFVRSHLVGRVLATALWLDGWLPLHGSAVAARDGAIGFLAPKGAGKSSLALALTEAGARLLTDDTLPVEPIDAPRAWPGVHSVRLREDALAQVEASPVTLGTHEGKRVLTGFAPERLAHAPVPLRALYLLDPGGPALAREPLPAHYAAAAVTGQVKIGRMLGPAAGGAMLARTSAIVARVPVLRLAIPRDLARLADHAAEILAWHGGPA